MRHVPTFGGSRDRGRFVFDAVQQGALWRLKLEF
jgi:hypothetical protein